MTIPSPVARRQGGLSLIGLLSFGAIAVLIVVLGMRVLPTDAQWYGVTYRDDREQVASAIGALQRRGDYPVPTWEHL